MSICDKLREELNEEYVRIEDIVDNLVSIEVNKPLSANQGVVLKELIDGATTRLVLSASVETCVTPDVPVPGYEVGDRYIDFLLNDENESHVYELLTELPLSDVATQTWVREYIDSLDGSSIEYPL